MTIYTLTSVQVGKPRQYGNPDSSDPDERLWVSAICKEPVEGPVRLRKLNLDGDGQADLQNHGGLDQAVLAYGASHYPIWRDELQRSDFAFGSFGENFTMDGPDESSVCIGDIWQIGETTVQVSMPRFPCWKISALHGIKDLTVRVERSGRTGWYLRVLEEGEVESGMSVDLINRPCPEITVTYVTRIVRDRKPDPEIINRLIACDPLALSVRERLSARLARSS